MKTYIWFFPKKYWVFCLGQAVSESIKSKHFLFNVEVIILRALSEIIRRTRGTTIVVWPKKIALRSILNTKPTTLSVIAYVLDRFREAGYITLWSDAKRWKRKRYKLDKGTPLWDALLNYNGETVDEMLQKLSLYDPPYKQ